MIATNKVVITKVENNFNDPSPHTLREIKLTIKGQTEKVICRRMNEDLMIRVLNRCWRYKANKTPVILTSRGNWTTKKWFNNVMA